MFARLFHALCLCTLLLQALAAGAQEAPLSALARLDGAASEIAGGVDQLSVTLALSQPVPWRLRVLGNPARLIIDFREVDFTALPDMPVTADAILGLRAGVFRPTWSRLVVQLAAPMVVARSEMVTAGAQGAAVNITLRAATDAEFADAAALPEPPEWQLPKSADLPPARLPLSQKTGPLIVMLDPGHGGIDPGAQQGNISEADLMLTFAREFKESLLRTGEAVVVLTREDNTFVPLEGRVSAARAAGADVFLSLHADALAEGAAKGATLYTLSSDASDKAAQTLAERHDRDDLLAGVDLTAQDDLIANVLIDMARLETSPKIDRLARALEVAIKGKGLKMHRFARQTAGFSVLKSPDIPSVLIELGFLSSPSDLANLTNPEWRAQMIAALQMGLLNWADAERAAPPAP
ncbi:MAG: N-acetylmuramoyl-L-alanine amidase [Cypionkella sp.]|nr:N-acetylmuramoyl-L-alanine amidase [Cypionkella sp.]